MLHLSDINKYERCRRYFQLSQIEKASFLPFVCSKEDFKQLVCERLRLRNVFIGEVNQDVSISLEALESYEAIMNARFSYRELRVSVPLLIKDANKYILYMTYRSCYPKEKEAQKIVDILYVLSTYDIFVDEIYAIHLNADYIRGEELNVDELLIISEYLYNSKNKAHKKIIDLLPQYQRDLDLIIDDLNTTLQGELIPAVRSNACTRGMKCPYYDKCFFHDAGDDSILHLVSSQHKFTMLDAGIEKMKDIDVNKIEGTRHQYAQIMAAKSKDGRYIDKNVLSIWLKEFTYPLSYLDFEWDTYSIPPYKGMKPYDVMLFQYSLHIEDDQGHLRHEGFIGKDDCREDFIQSLLSSIPKEGSIVVFNMEGAEKLRLKQLAQQFPKYEAALKQIWERMIDLSLPFSSGSYYDLRMRGGYSLKTLVPLFSKYDYKELDISHGMEAVEQWRLYCNCDNEQEQQAIYAQLEKYCSLDTYAEYIIYHALLKSIE